MRTVHYLLAAVLSAAFAWAADVSIVIGNEMPGTTIRPLLGVNAGPTPAGEAGNPDFTNIYKQAGVTLVRTHDYYGPLDMPTIYPDQNADPANPASYRFETSDATFRAIVNGGFEPFLRIGDSYNNVRTVTNRANWAKAAVYIVKRYTDTTLWGASKLRYVEIYNEPDNQQFWKGTPIEFYQLYAETAKALKTAYPSLKIGGPGFAPSAALAPRVQAWSRDFVTYVKTNAAPLDFLSWHLYSDNPADFATVADYYRGLLTAAGLNAVESVVTEFNTADVDASGNPATRTGLQGAALMTASWITLQQKGIAQAMFYRGQDTSIRLPTFFGLWLADGRPKPVGLAFQLWAQLCKYPARAEVTASGLYVLAGRNSEGQAAWLIANPTATATAWKAALPGGIPTGSVARLQQVPASGTALTAATLTELASGIPAWGVQLVTVEPAPVRIFSSASYAEQNLAPGSLASIFGAGLGTMTSVVVKDAAGVERDCTILFSNANQINAVLPTGMATGPATFSVMVRTLAIATGTLNVVRLAPGLFSLANDGKGLAAANVVRYRGATAIREPVAQYDTTTGSWKAVPIDLSPEGDRVFLFLYGTGLRGAERYTASIGGTSVAVQYAGAQGEYAGLDQVNIELPRSLAGKGTVRIVLAADASTSNAVEAVIK